jgi:7-cyano-7-deazaguanine tRNA-ribosyltransferase
MKFETLNTDALGRNCKIELNNKKILTPNLFPVVHPYNNLLNPPEIEKIGFNNIFTNAYILYNNSTERKKVLKKGLSNYLDFEGLIATDSGAFQQYMYHKEDITIKPHEIERFQEKIGSDFPVILDVPVQPDDDYETAKKKVDLSIARAKENIKRRKTNCCWMGPIHGAKYRDLLEKSTLEMDKLNFGVYAIGGLVKFFLEYRFKQILKILITVKKFVTPNKPLHMFGLGLPQFFSLAVAFGCDLMDSAAYILYAKDDRYFSLTTGTKQLTNLNEFACNCPICVSYTPKELKNLNKRLRTKLLAKHNLYVSLTELKNIRQSIREGNLWELVETRVRSHPNLINALEVLKENRQFFEKYEKTYKSHGRFLTSLESKYRPLIFRYKKRIKEKYRIPSYVKYLIIIPELDIKGRQSQTITKWLEKIHSNENISREKIHIVFISGFFGIIPLELINTYPMGQHEAIKYNAFYNCIHEELAKEITEFINNHSIIYKKCALLIPNEYINQFNENMNFNNKIYNKIFNYVKEYCKIPIYKSSTISDILRWF